MPLSIPMRQKSQSDCLWKSIIFTCLSLTTEPASRLCPPIFSSTKALLLFQKRLQRLAAGWISSPIARPVSAPLPLFP